MPKMKRERWKLKKEIGSDFKNKTGNMLVNELEKVEEEKEEKMNEIKNFGEQLTDMMNEDWLKVFRKNKELKALKLKVKHLDHDLKQMDLAMVPKIRKFKRDWEDWELEIEGLEEFQQH